MKLEEGKYYKSRDGHVFGPIAPTEYRTYRWECRKTGNIFTGKGMRFYGVESDCDLLEECNPDGSPLQCNADGSATDDTSSSPIPDNRAVLERAMREGKKVRWSSWSDRENPVPVKDMGKTFLWTGEETWQIEARGGIWQIVEPKVTAEDLCEAIEAIEWEYAVPNIPDIHSAQELARKYRKQQAD